MKPHLLLLLTVLCFGNQLAVAQNVYKSTSHKFFIHFPDGWEVKESQQQNTIVKAVKRYSSGRISLVAVASYQGKPFDIWDLKPNGMLQSLKAVYPTSDVKLLESGKTMLNGVKAVWSVVIVRPLGSPVAIQSITYHLMRGSSEFRISGTTNAEESWFKQERPTLQKSIETFRFID